jgi:hypothetical protein
VPQSPDKLDGEWEGALEFPQGNLPLVLHLRIRGYSMLDSPYQKILGVPVTISFRGRTLRFDAPSVATSFEGEMKGIELKGVMIQSGMSFPLTFRKNIDVSGISDPADPPTRDDANGEWAETKTGPANFDAIFRIDLNGDSTLVSLVPNAPDTPINVTVNGDQVIFSLPLVGVRFEGTMRELTITGALVVGKRRVPVVLHKRNDGPLANRSGARPPFSNINGLWVGKVSFPPNPAPYATNSYEAVMHINLRGRSTLRFTEMTGGDFPIVVSVSDSPGSLGDRMQQMQSGLGDRPQAVGNGEIYVSFSVPSMGASFTGVLRGTRLTGTLFQPPTTNEKAKTAQFSVDKLP